MSVSTMPTWWADPRPRSPTVSTPSLRVEPRAVRVWRGLGVLAAILAVSAAAAALPMSSPETPMAQRTLAAENIQNLASLVQESEAAQPEYKPQLYRMLPITDRATQTTCAPGC